MGNAVSEHMNIFIFTNGRDDQGAELKVVEIIEKIAVELEYILFDQHLVDGTITN